METTQPRATVTFINVRNRRTLLTNPWIGGRNVDISKNLFCLCANLLYIKLIHSVYIFPMDGHSFQWIWTRFGMQPPYKHLIVMRRLFLQRNRMMPKHHGKILNASCRGSSSSSYQPRPAAAVDGRACRHSGDNSCGVSNDKARVCRLLIAIVQMSECVLCVR